MSLSQVDRITMSKKLVSAPADIAAINFAKIQIAAAQVAQVAVDNTNKNIFTPRNTLCDIYQTERQYLTGIQYTTFTESDVINAANLVSGNYFYPTTPSVWLAKVPYAMGRALGLNTDGSTPSTITTEASYISTLTSAINAVLVITPNNVANQITGQTCPVGGTGVGGVNLTLTTGFAAAVSAANTAASNWATSLTNQISALNTIISTDTDPTRNAAAVTAKASAQTALTAANTWIALLATIPYTQGTDLTQAQFNAATASSATPAPLGLDPSNQAKFNPTNVSALQAAISTRSSFVSSRTSDLSTYFGGWAFQNSSTGALSGVTPGFYYNRYLALQLRINLLGGSLVGLNGIGRALAAQDDQIAAINTQVAVYETLMTCSQFSAPASDTNYVNLLSTAGFSVSDYIYIVSDDYPELTATIMGINGKRITLNIKVPSTYLESNFARLYKDLT